VIVEGEKCVHGMHTVGIVATTSPGGAGKAEHADWGPLAGKTAILWPDFDPPGIAHMRQVAGILGKLQPAPRLLWIDPSTLGLDAKGDVFDFIETLADLDPQGRRAAVDEVLASATPLGPGRELVDLVEATITGRRRALPWPWGYLGKLTRAFLPGTCTILCGQGGASKSFLVLQAAAWWVGKGHRVALYELEGTRAEHLVRALAQAAGDARLVDPEWVRENPEETRAALAAHERALDTLGGCIWEAPPRPPDLPALANWISERAEEGVEIIAIDPLTAAAATDKPWVSDSMFVQTVKPVLSRTGARLLLVAHPRKGHKTAALDELAGGAVYARLANTVLWFEYHEPPAQLVVLTALGETSFGVNRTIRILKAREGRGTGARLAWTFNPDTLTCQEHGLVVKGTRRGAPAIDDDAAWEAG
ncbi:MAG TPA: AAA family ATPase, partial [Phycisphaerae bacterium]|nr:AAA family ATPase [Phycisphaerae bacterium]